MLEEILQNMKRVLDLRTDAGLELLESLHELSHRILWQRLALAALHCDMPISRGTLILGTLLDALITGVTETRRIPRHAPAHASD